MLTGSHPERAGILGFRTRADLAVTADKVQLCAIAGVVGIDRAVPLASATRIVLLAHGLLL
jgi:hypothetical protein